MTEKQNKARHKSSKKGIEATKQLYKDTGKAAIAVQSREAEEAEQ